MILKRRLKSDLQASFSKVKEDIHSLKQELASIKELLLAINNDSPPIPSYSEEESKETLSPPPEELLDTYELPLEPSKDPLSPPSKTSKNPENATFSIGNKGVYAVIHSLNSHSTAIHSTDSYADIKHFLRRITKQELLTLLTLYQLEEDQSNITYTEIAQKLGLSEGCVRTYISSIIKKNGPIMKEKYNNKTVILSIRKEFRELNLKQLLINHYYKTDPLQKKLSEV